ncbi:MAG: MogA/MoaB family molybdenum cofactor biosynthesis protein [Desulfobacteraceae bacterium]|nr:MogA/MoaB family molybdenum cofactor biosynthesis protein [Desulfobacteraceae bacterium]
MGTHQHRAEAPLSLKLAVLSISTTRALENDESGHWIARQAAKEKHQVVAHQVVPDDVAAIRQAVARFLAEQSPDAIIATGGTGLTPTDVTIEALRPLFSKELTAFGPIFAQLSYEEIDSAAILSRATAGVVGRTLIFCIPGSLKACKLACNALIFPELGHAVKHALGR